MLTNHLIWLLKGDKQQVLFLKYVLLDNIGSSMFIAADIMVGERCI